MPPIKKVVAGNLDDSSENKLFTWDLLQGNNSNKKQKMVDPKKHDELEKEYLRLRKKIVVTSSGEPAKAYSEPKEGIKDSRGEDSVATPHSLGAESTCNDMLALPLDLFQSDSLGMNHFRKHILNVKATSKRYKRALRGSDQKPGAGGNNTTSKRVQFKFKPLYERKMSEDSLRAGPLGTRTVEGH